MGDRVAELVEEWNAAIRSLGAVTETVGDGFLLPVGVPATKLEGRTRLVLKELLGAFRRSDNDGHAKIYRALRAYISKSVKLVPASEAAEAVRNLVEKWNRAVMLFADIEGFDIRQEETPGPWVLVPDVPDDLLPEPLLELRRAVEAAAREAVGENARALVAIEGHVDVVWDTTSGNIEELAHLLRILRRR